MWDFDILLTRWCIYIYIYILAELFNHCYSPDCILKISIAFFSLFSNSISFRLVKLGIDYAPCTFVFIRYSTPPIIFIIYYQVYCILYSKGRHRSIYLRYRLILDAGGDAISKTSIIMWVSHFADHFLIGRSEP